MGPKLLLTGASGFLGWHLCQQLKTQYQIAGAYFRQQPDLSGIEWLSLNLINLKDLARIVRKLQPDIILHCAALSNPNFCQRHPAISQHVNVLATLELASLAKELRIPFIFTSSDLIFNGNSAPYDEDAFAYPLSRYGEQKLAAEESLLNDFSQTVVCRLPLLFGWGGKASNCFFKTWNEQLVAGKVVKAFTDEYRSPQSAGVVANLLERVLLMVRADALVGDARLLHLGGPLRISRYDFAVKMAKLQGFSADLVQPCLRASLKMSAPRPKDVSLDSQRSYRLLNLLVPSLEEQLNILYQQAPES